MRGKFNRYLQFLAAGLLILLCGAGAKAQNDLMLTQHWVMPTFYNPAFTGNTDFLRIRAGARLQWIGVENAPRSFVGTADSPIRISTQRIGVGISAMQESLGLFSNLLLSFQASYKFKLFKGIFSVGVQPSYFNTKFRGSDVVLPDNDDYHQGNDTSIPTRDLTGNHFDLSAGVSYTHKYFSVGVSCMHILSPTVNMAMEGSQANDTQEYEIELARALYLTAYGNIPIKNTLFELQPSLLLTSDLAGFTGEVGLRTTYHNFLSVGLAYRWQDAIGITIGGEYKNFFLGYAYEYPLSGIHKATSGSHEIMAGYSLKLDFSGKNKNKHRSIRLM